VETGEAICAWGAVDETESAGADRFEAVRSWSAGVRARLHFVGADRPATAPIFVGGFGFEEAGSSSEDWKAFPAARFVLPAVLGERSGARARWVLFTRVEPTASAQNVVAELESRLGEALDSQRGPESGHAALETAPHDGEAGSCPRTDPWPEGPEYRVRSDRAHAVFRGQVRRALDEIEAGGMEKVVLARSLCVLHDGELEVAPFLARLRDLYPSCTLVAMGRGRDVFLAATPETLVRLEGRRIETAALAGSAPRGRTPEEDRQLAEALLASAKDRAEHAHVVDALREGLEPFCEALELSSAPRLRALFGIQHLETPIRAQLHTDVRPGGRDRPAELLDLAAALHPTPAVGGVPREAARGWLRRFEGLDRGWYAAPIGWLDGQGGGDLRVALRSALIRNGLGPSDGSAASRARLFGGAGIVAGSQPEQELVETRIKLRALLAPLTEI
ncbi:MAG: isochorismate synthase, partial [Deltaproteobacteria bacterium]|jgi:isochorismate synthase|nr:isochorismate synthase [Deltaproteobacteria bacterium]